MAKHRRISLNTNLINKIEKFIHDNPDYGYRSIASFVEDAARRRAEQVGIYLEKQTEDS